MAIKLADRVRVSTATTGTGTINLGAALSGYRTFAQAVTDGALVSGATVYYVIEDGANWEVGSGAYTSGAPDTLARTVASSSAGGTTAISLSGTANVYLACTAASLMTATISGGAIDGTAIGAGTPSTGSFTTLTSTNGSAFVGANALATAANINFNAAAGNAKQLTFMSGGSTRWTIGADNVAEAASFTRTTTGTAAAAQAQITLTSITSVALNQTVAGTNIPLGSQVDAINGSIITISNNITTGGVASGATLTFYPNTGTNFGFSAWDDVANWQGFVISIARNTQLVSMTSLAMSGSITPSQTAGIVGTTTNNDVGAGGVGEFISSTIATASAVSITTATAKNVTSVSLTAGDWDVWGQITTKPAGTTTQTVFNAGISQTTATLPTPSATAGGLSQMSATFTAGTAISMAVTPARMSLSTTTSVFLVVSCTFSTSTNAAFGFIAARRHR